jgi:hypothetical protein
VLQAGQALLLAHGRQLATLTRDQLARCVEQLKYDHAGLETPARISEWNGHPIDISPAGGLLAELGFRLDKRGAMCWPPPADAQPVLLVSDEQAFLPYFSEPPPVEYGPEWIVSRASEAMRPALKRVFEVLVAELDREGWELTWHDWGPVATYQGSPGLSWHMGKSFVHFHVSTRVFHDQGERHRVRRRFRVESEEDVDEALVARLRKAIGEAEELIDRFVPRDGGQGARQGTDAPTRDAPTRDAPMRAATRPPRSVPGGDDS